jgi:hypothetical protein
VSHSAKVIIITFAQCNANTERREEAYSFQGQGLLLKDEDDGDEDVRLLAEQTLSSVSSHLHLFWSPVFSLSLRSSNSFSPVFS